MREHIKIVLGIIIVSVIGTIVLGLVSWCDYQAQQRLDKIAEETRARKLECYEKYKTEECFRM